MGTGLCLSYVLPGILEKYTPKEQLGLSLLCVAQQTLISSEQGWVSYCFPRVAWADVLIMSLYFSGDQCKILLHEPSSQQLNLSLLSLASPVVISHPETEHVSGFPARDGVSELHHS